MSERTLAVQNMGNLCKSCAFISKSKKLGVAVIPITSNILNLGPSLKYMILADQKLYRPENLSHRKTNFFHQNSKNYIPLERKLNINKTPLPKNEEQTICNVSNKKRRQGVKIDFSSKTFLCRQAKVKETDKNSFFNCKTLHI